VVRRAGQDSTLWASDPRKPGQYDSSNPDAAKSQLSWLSANGSQRIVELEFVIRKFG